MHHDFIIEDLDDQTLVVKEAKLKELKQRLDEVNASSLLLSNSVRTLAHVTLQVLRETQQMPEDSESE